MSETTEQKKKFSWEQFRKTFGILLFILPYKGKFSLGLMFLFLSSFTTLAFPFLSGKLIDVATGKGNFYGLTITQICLTLMAVLGIQSIFSFYRVVLFAQVTEKSIADVRVSLFKNLVRLPMSFFDTNRVGELNSRLTSDIAQLQDVMSVSLAELFRQISVLLVGMGLIFYTSTSLALFMLATFPFLVLMAIVMGRSIRKLSKKNQDQLATSNVIVEESLQSIQVVKAFVNEGFEIQRYSKAIQEVVQIALNASKYRAFFISTIILGLFGGIVLILWYGTTLLAEGRISIGDLMSFVLYTTFIGASVAGIGEMYSQLQKSVGATERVRELLAEQPEPWKASAPNVVLKGNITFKDISFSYPTRPELRVLDHVNFEIAEGEKIALVGHSGAGKSTIVQLLLQFYTPSEGQILWNGVSNAELDLADVRANIGIVPQEVLLFGGTIADNIWYGNPQATMDDVYEAAHKAYAMEFIEKFPEGMNTTVGERGVKLSGGQKQRIAIARAILKNPTVLILDEATSALDAASEHWVQMALDHVMQNRTTLMIAHRLSTIRKADKILVLEQGKVVEAGSHAQLAALDHGKYAQLLQMQYQTA